MPIELDQKTLSATRAQLDNVERGLGAADSRSGRHSVHNAMADAIDEAMRSPVLERARELGEPHVGERVTEIKPVEGRWVGNAYVAGLRSDNEVVLAHNFGSGTHGGSGPYTIEPDRNGEALAIQMGGSLLRPEIVVHPGVRGKRFLQRAVAEETDDLVDDARTEALEALDDALSPRRR